jgi:hypothetical protein
MRRALFDPLRRPHRIGSPGRSAPRGSTAPRRARRPRVVADGKSTQTAWGVTGRDVSHSEPPKRRLPGIRPASLGVVAAGAVCAALLLVALRMDSVRLRYALADAVRAEQTLLDEQRSLTVEVRQLRDPRRLEGLGRELGLVPAGCTIDLDHPRPCPAVVHAGSESAP